MATRDPRPVQYPRQFIALITDELGDRIDADAAARGDCSKSGAARRLLELGKLLADALATHGTTDPVDDPDNVLDDLLDAAAAVR